MKNDQKIKGTPRAVAMKLRAHEMIMVKDFTQTKTAKELGVSINTVNTWCKEYGWYKAQDEIVKNITHANLFASFMAYISKADHETYRKIMEHLKQFLFLKKSEI